jgi:hypothetical protein
VKILHNGDGLPFKGKSFDNRSTWYKPEDLIPCHNDGYELISPLDEEESYHLVSIGTTPLMKATTKDIYHKMLSKYQLSPKAIKNASKYNWNLQKMFKTLKKLVIPMKIKNTWYQILHNSIKVMTNVHSQNQTKICQMCKREKEDIPHLLSRCKTTKFLQIPNWSHWPTDRKQLADVLTTHYLIWKTRCEIVIGKNQINKKQILQQLEKMKEFNYSLILHSRTKQD